MLEKWKAMIRMVCEGREKAEGAQVRGQRDESEAAYK